MDKKQFESLKKAEERSAVKNVKSKGKGIDKNGMARAEDKVLVKLPRQFCKEIKKYLQSGKIVTFYEMNMPRKNSEIDGVNVGGSRFYPIVMFEDRFNENLMCASFLKDWNLYLKLPDGEIFKTTPSKLQSCIKQGYQKYKEEEQKLEKEIEEAFGESFYVLNREGERVSAKNSTPVHMLDTDIAEKILNYALKNGIAESDSLQAGLKEGTVKDLKTLFIKGRENEISEDENNKAGKEKESVVQKDIGEEI